MWFVPLLPALAGLSSLWCISDIVDSSPRRSAFDGVSALASVGSAVGLTSVGGTGG